MNFQQLESTWIQAGGTPGWAPLMAGIALAESGGTPHAVQKGQPYATTGWGLWQITPGDSESQVGTNNALLTPTKNAKAAIAKFASQGLTAWRTDRVWDQWHAAGSPRKPTAAMVRGYLSAAGIGGGTDTTTTTTPGTAKGGTQPTGEGGATDTLKSTTCAIKFPGVAGVGSFCVLSKSNLRAIEGGLLVGAGGLLLLFGIVLVGGYGLGSAALRKKAQQIINPVAGKGKAPAKPTPAKPTGEANAQEKAATPEQLAGTPTPSGVQLKAERERSFDASDVTEQFGAQSRARAAARRKERRPRASKQAA